VVDVTVGKEDRHGLELVLAQDVVQGLFGAVPGIDDHALLARCRGNDPAVGLPRTGGKPHDEHGRQTNRLLDSSRQHGAGTDAPS